MSVQAGFSFRPEVAARPDAKPGDTRPTPGLFDQAAAAMRVEADRVEVIQEDRLNRAYRPIIDAMLERGVSPQSLRSSEAIYLGGSIAAGAPSAAYGYDYARIYRTAQRLGLADLPATREEFERKALRRNGARDVDQDTLARGGGVLGTVAQFGGGMVGAMADPVNILTLPFGGWGKSIAGRILSEGALNAGIEASQFFTNRAAYDRMGEKYGAEEAAMDVGLAFAGGAALQGGLEAAPAVGRAVKRLDDAGYRAAAPLRDKFDRFFADRDLARAFADQVPEELRTPEQAAALQVFARETAIEEASPYVRTITADEAHRSNIGRAADQVSAGRIGGFDMGRYLQRTRSAESGGNDIAAARTSSAYGRFQFLKDTWLEFYKKTFGETGESRDAILAKRASGAVQDRVMRTFTQENARALQRAGVPVNDATVYLAHFLGRADALRVLRAAEDAPIEQLVDAGSIAANRAVFNPQGRPPITSASELVAWAHRKMGGEGQGVPAARDDAWSTFDLGDDELPILRPDALDAERPIVTSGGRQIPIAQFPAAQIGVDAELMQFKSGGDQFGVTERLQGVQEWDPIAAGMVTVWEANDGRRLIADGHQRLGLARRIEAGGGQPVMVNAFVLRESEGFNARDARIITALKNIGEGTGTGIDAAKVLREAGPFFEEMIERRLPPKSALVRDGKALARLSDEAFGAVVNEVIPEGHAAAIGHLAPDPETHMALVELLAETDPPNRRQAESIVRQALDAGFTRETQEELFGSRDLVRGLFAQRAKLLDKTLAELRKLKGAFGVAARNAEALDAAGNRIDIGASEAAAAGNARALALVDRLALRKGNAVNELLDQAARRLAGGEPIARVTRDLVKSIRELDLADLERAGSGADGASDGAFGSGRFGELAGEGSETGLDGPSAADLDALEAEVDLGPSLFDDPNQSRLFDDDDGDGVQAAAESDWHDIRQMQAELDDSSGPFGPVFEDVDPADWPAVLQRLQGAGAGEVRGALSHPEIGPIDVVWGVEGTGRSDGYGLAKLVKFHPEVVQDLPALVRSLPVKSRSANRIQLESADHKAAVRLDYDGQAKSWLLTAMRKDGSPPATEDRGVAGGSRDHSPGAGDDLEIGDLPQVDKSDEPTFDLDDGKGPRTAAEIEAELADERAAIDEIRACLK